MTEFSISEVAREVGLRSSAIRYYEEIGILASPARVNGQRRYDAVALDRLTIIQRARQLGFSLREIRALFFEFDQSVPASARWKEMSGRKLAELDRMTAKIATLRAELEAQSKCGCASLDECGRCTRRAS
ncbi:MAG: MerR family transcriptional regulator [Gemmatimonadales bacterium]